MTLQPERPGSEEGGIDRLSYRPMHDYRTVDVDALAEQWFSGFASLDPDSEAYRAAEFVVYRQLHLHPEDRESDAQDLGFGLDVLRSVGGANPYDAGPESGDERMQHQQRQQMDEVLKLIARQIVRVTLDDAEDYAAFRVEQEYSGTDYLSGTANRRGLVRLLHDRYGITDDPVRRTSSGAPLPPIRLTHLYADANRFRWLNNTFGHQVGDAAIVETSWRAKDFLRTSDSPIICRYGGDEFGAILGGLNDDEVERLTRRVNTRQLDRIINPEFKYRESMAAVEEAVRFVEESGKRIRAEAHQTKLTKVDLAMGRRPHYVLCINGRHVTELKNIITLSVGMSSAMVSTLSEVEQLRRDADVEMERIKHILKDVIDGKITIRPEDL